MSQTKEFISHTTTDIVETKNTKEGSAHPYDFRYQIYLTRKDHLSRIKKPRFSFWNFFTKVLCSPLVIKSFLNLYKKEVKERFANDLNNILFFPDIMLLHDKVNYSLGPHTDIAPKDVTTLIYLFLLVIIP